MDKQAGWAEKAVNNSKVCWNGFISSRVELALERVSRDFKYTELCERQKEKEDEMESILGKLDHKERIAVRRYYEDDTAMKGHELDEVYKQGIRDGIQFLLYLDIFQVKEWMGEKG